MKWTNIRTIPLVTITLLVLFTAGSACGSEASPPDFVVAPEAGRYVSQMVGVEVYNSKHEDLARIEDVNVGKDGRVQAYILDVSEYLGVVAHFVAVKPSALTIEPAKGDGPPEAHLDATAEQLRAAPEYSYTGTRKACLKILRF